MTIDYSKWDNLDVSDGEESPKPKVTKLNPNQQVVLEREGYRIKDHNPPDYNLKDNGDSSGKIDSKDTVMDVSKEWYKRVLHGVVTVDSHLFSQDRYLVNFLLLVDFEYKNLRLEFEESSMTVYDGNTKLFTREFYSKIRNNENFWTWELVTLEVDWAAIKAFSQTVNNEKKKTSLYFKEKKSYKFLEVNIHKLQEIQDCFMWWPKLFKDDVEEVRVVDNSDFIKIWDEAHENFKKKVSSFEKIPI